jgi:hypothetical protein
MLQLVAAIAQGVEAGTITLLEAADILARAAVYFASLAG